jgi:hypothetical protein
MADHVENISGRLKTALVADMAMADLSEENTRWMTVPVRGPRDWTGHLARQLGVQELEQDSDNVHYTLMVVIPELDKMLREWPPPTDPDPYVVLARAATKNLQARLVYDLLLVGPPAWRDRTIDGGRVESLRARLQYVLEQALASDLQQVVARWDDWDVRELKKRRDEAVQARRKAEEAELEAVKEQSRAARKPPSRKELADRIPRQGWFVPPGRT